METRRSIRNKQCTTPSNSSTNNAKACKEELPILPDDAWQSVFRLLSLTDLFSVRAACKRFREISNNNNLWEAAIKESKPEVHSNITTHTKLNTVRQNLMKKHKAATKPATVTKHKLRNISQPCDRMEGYMKRCIGVQNQKLGQYHIFHHVYDEEKYRRRCYDCDGVLLAISTGGDGIDIFFVSGCSQHIHTIQLPSALHQVKIEGNHLAAVLNDEIRVYMMDREQLTFTMKHKVARSEGTVRVSGDWIAIMEKSSPGVLKLLSLSSGESHGSISLDIQYPDFINHDNHDPFFPWDFQLKQHYVYFLHHSDPELMFYSRRGHMANLVSCYNMETCNREFEEYIITELRPQRLSQLTISEDRKLLFAHVLSDDDSGIGVFINGRTGYILEEEVQAYAHGLMSSEESECLCHPVLHVDWKNSLLINYYSEDHETESVVCGVVRSFTEKSFHGRRLYQMYSDPVELDTEDTEDYTCRQIYVHNDLLFSLVKEKVIVRGLMDGEVKYRIALPPTADDDNVRNIIFIDDYKMILKTETYLAFITFT